MSECARKLGWGRSLLYLALLGLLPALLLLANPAPAAALTVVGLEPGHITTVAGTGKLGSTGDGGLAVNARLVPGDIALDAQGNLYIIDAYRVGYYTVRKVDRRGLITTIPGVSASSGLAVDAAGNLILSQFAQVQVLAAADGTFYGIPMTAGNLYTVAGTGTRGYSGDGGPATAAQLANPGKPAVDGAGNLVIPDKGNDRIRVVATRDGTFYGIPMTAGNIYTVAGTGEEGYSGDGGPAVNAKVDPSDVAVDPAGNLVIADGGNKRIRVVAVRDGTFYGVAMTAGNIYTVAGTGEEGYSGDGGPATAAQLHDIRDVAVDGAGNLYLADSWEAYVRKVDPSGIISTIAGNGRHQRSGENVPAAGAGLWGPSALAVDAAGNLYVTEQYRVRFIQMAPAATSALAALSLEGSPDLDYYGAPLPFDLSSLLLTGADRSGEGLVVPQFAVTWAVKSGPASVSGSTLSITGSGPVEVYASVGEVRSNTLRFEVGEGVGPDLEGLALGAITTLAGNGAQGYYGDGGLANGAALGSPVDVVVDKAGNLLIAGGGRVRLVAARDGTFYGIAARAGNIYTVAGTGEGGYSGDGGPATAARVTPTSLAVDDAGNLYIGDEYNYCVRKVDPGGTISTVVGTGQTGVCRLGRPAAGQPLSQCRDVAVDRHGNLFIVEFNRVLMIPAASGTYYGQAMTAGCLYNIAGNGDGVYGIGAVPPEVDGRVANEVIIMAMTVAVDEAGNVWITDNKYRILKVDPEGIVCRVAGTGAVSGYSGDGGPASEALLSSGLTGIMADGSGNVYFCDGSRIRQIDSAGIIRTVVGSGEEGFAGDGGPALEAKLNNTQAVAIDGAGNLYVADYGNCRVRFVKLAPDREPVLTRLYLGGSPALSYAGTAFTFDLSQLSLSGIDRAGFSFDLAGRPVTWEVRSGPATVSGSLLTVTGAGAVEVAASVAGVSSNVLRLEVTEGAPVPVTGVSLDQTALTLPVGSSFRLTATVTPAEATNQSLRWSTDNQAVATVDDTGQVRAVAPGQVQITVTTVDGGFSATCLVTVTPAEPGVNLISPSPGQAYQPGDTVTVSGTAFDLTGLTLEVTDPEGQSVHREENLPVADGLFSTSFTLGQEAPTGRYLITIGAAELEDPYRSVIRVGPVDTGGPNPGRPDQIILSWTEDPATTQTISWRTTSDVTQGKVQYLPAADFDGSFEGAREAAATSIELYQGHRHFEATLRGLVPGTRYVYRVGTEGVWSEPGFFTTDDGDDRFRFLFLGDVQEGFNEWGDLLRVVAGEQDQPEFALLAGDLVNEGESVEEWQQFFAAATTLFDRIALLPAAGNHDDTRLFWDSFALPQNGPAGLEEQFYSFDYGPCHIAVLNSNAMGSPSSSTYQAVTAWLRQDLNRTDRRWKILMFHFPPYPAKPDGHAANLQANWVPIFEECGVDLVFVGHQHVYMRTHPIKGGQVQEDPQGAIVYVMGNSGSKYYAFEPYDYVAKAVAQVSNYEVVEIDGDTLTLTARDANGQVIDRFTLQKPPTGGPGVLYTLIPLDDAAYQAGTTPDGINTLTVNSAVSGRKYFGVQVQPGAGREGWEAVVFVHLRDGAPLGLSVARADFDRVTAAQAGFEVQPGDVVKVYLVDELTDALDSNPTVLQ
jgi:hypothetical protein